jgi:hypothetical protein
MTQKILIGAGTVLLIATTVILTVAILSPGTVKPTIFYSELPGNEKSFSTISSEPRSYSQTANSLKPQKTPQKTPSETLNLNKDEQLANALFNDLGAHNERLDALTALKKENGNSIVAYEILRLCALEPSHLQCSTETIDNITSAHQNDSQIWMQAVNYFLATSQFDLAASAAKRGMQGSYSTAVLAVFIQHHNQTLKDAGVGNFGSNTIAAVGLHAAFAQPLGHISKWCKDTSNNPSTAQACLNIGKLWEQNGTDKFERDFGLSIQDLVYEAEENTEMLALSEQKRRDIYEKDSQNEFENLALALSNESLLNSYLEYYSYGGQIYAATAIKTDIDDYKKTLEYRTCYQQR